MRERSVRLIIAFFFVWLAYAVFNDLWIAHLAIHPYKVGDWQINYAGGFVRRGLLGELARQLASSLAINTTNTALWIQFASYAVFLLCGLRLVVPVVARYPIFAFAVFSPLTFSFAAADPAACGRKEIVYLAVLAAQGCWMLQRAPKAQHTGRLLVTLSIVSFVLTLTHEMLALFLPFQLALVTMLSPTPMPARKLALVATPTILAVVLSAAFRGDATNVQAICASLGASAPPRCATNGAISWLGISNIDTIRSIYYQIAQPPFMLLTTAVSALLGAVSLAVLAVDHSLTNKLRELFESTVTRRLAVLSIILPLPLFVVASDHGRWLHIWFASATITLATAIHHKLLAERARSGSVDDLHNRWSLTLPIGLWVVFFLGYATFWHAPGVCCPDRLGSGFLGQAFNALWQHDFLMRH